MKDDEMKDIHYTQSKQNCYKSRKLNDNIFKQRGYSLVKCMKYLWKSVTACASHSVSII